MVDTVSLLGELGDVDVVIGIARSGLPVASLLAMMLHRPLLIYRPKQKDLISASNGWRLTGNTSIAGKAVVVDDTVMSGNSFKTAMPNINICYPDAITAAVYVNPLARYKPTIWAKETGHPHLLEWNLANSVFTQQSALDFDGILCRDCKPEDDDDGPRYMKFLETTKPLYLSRRAIVPLIVTARLEKYRAVTENWLARHGVRFSELVMHPAKTLSERNRTDIAAYKAEHYAKFLTRDHLFNPPMFIESDPRQAQRIAQLTGGLTVCPQAGRCYGPS